MFNKFLLAATLITVASSQSASAGTLRFSGTTGGSNVTFGGKAWSFAVTYTPGAGATAQAGQAMVRTRLQSLKLRASITMK
jgi:hypothetical protein